MLSRQFVSLCAIAALVQASSLDVPFVRQQKQGCGPASVAMLMQYWTDRGAEVDKNASAPDVIYRALYESEKKGASGEAMASYLRTHSFLAFIINGEWSDLTGNLSRGRPLIVCLKPSIGKGPLHFVVVVGLKEDRDGVVINDPARGANIAMSLESFDAEWRATGRWTLISTPATLKSANLSVTNK